MHEPADGAALPVRCVIGGTQVRVAPAARRQAVAHRLVRTAAQPSPGTASACQHVTSDRKIPSSRKLPRFGAVVTTAATPCALASACASTGHVWITVWRRHGLNPFRIFSLPIESMPSGLVTGAWPPGSPGMSLASHRHPGILHSSSTNLVHSRLRS